MNIVGSIVSQYTGNDTIDVSINGTTLGNGLIIQVYWAGGAVEDMASTDLAISGETITWLTVRKNATVNNRVQIGYVKSLASGGTKQFTGTYFALSESVVDLIEVSGQDTAAFYDSAEGGASGNGTGTNASCTVTTNTASASIFARVSTDNDTPGVDTGYIIIANATGSSTRGEYNLNVGAAGAKTVQMTLVNLNNWVIAAAAFFSASGFDPKTIMGPNAQMLAGGMVGKIYV